MLYFSSTNIINQKMKKYLILLVVMATMWTHAQEITVIYNENRKAIYSRLQSYIPPEQRPSGKETEFSTFEYKSILRIDNGKSIYYPQDEVTNDTLNVQITYNDTVRLPLAWVDDFSVRKKVYKNLEVSEKNFSIIYQDLTSKEKVSTDRYSGKEYLISEKLEKYDWKITNEKKTIGKYMCRKAILELEHDDTEIHVIGHEHIHHIEVWFTEDISVEHGPSGYWGLPGLILEVKEGSTHILLDKIVFDIDSFVVKPPTTGEKVTREGFKELPMLEFMEN